MAAWLAILAAVHASGLVTVDHCPAGSAASVCLVVGLDPCDIAPAKRGVDAVFTQALLGQISNALTQETATAKALRTAVPPRRGVQLIRDLQYLAVTLNCRADALPLALDFIAEQVLATKLDEKAVEEAKHATLLRRDEWARDVVEPTQELFERALYRGLWPDAFYGTPETIGSVTLADVNAFARRVLVRDNVRLALVVPQEPQMLAARAEKVMNELPEGRRRGPVILAQEKRIAVRDNPALGRASLVVGGPIPSFGEKGYWAACVLRQMLSGAQGTLMRDRQLTSQLGLFIPPSLTPAEWPVQPLEVPVCDAPYLAVYALCHPVRIEPVRAAIVSHLEAFAEGKFSDADFDRGRLRAANAWAVRTAAPRDRAFLLAITSLMGTQLPDARQAAQVLETVTRDDVMAVARG
ncbi:MAG: insulinase family protein, partial [Armatimonadetes bacterium]|nr:insulinase family protein [Armatimonadota bacterium]